MQPFNPKVVVISGSNLLATLFTHGLLTACNHVGAYHAMQDQASTRGASSTPIEHRLGVEQERMVAQKLDALYNQICDSKIISGTREKKPLDHLIAFKEAVENENMPFHTALKACSRRTGRMLSFNHLYCGRHADHFELIAQVIYADVVDTNDEAKLAYYREVDIDIVRDAISCMDKIKELNKELNDSNDLLEQYKGYNSLKRRIKNQSVPLHIYTQIDKIIIDILHKLLIENEDTLEKRLQVAFAISPEDVALFRHAFEITDEAYPGNSTGVLHPAIYRILSKERYPIALGEKDLLIVKTYLKKNYPQLFNRHQPYIPLFHDKASKDDMLFNRAYMKIHNAVNTGATSDALNELRMLAIEKRVSFQEVLRRCKENTGWMLEISHIADSIYNKRYDLVLDTILSGVVDQESVQPNYILGQYENLRAYVERHKQENADQIANNIGYRVMLRSITDLLD